MIRVMGNLEILGYEEIRGVVGELDPKGEGYQALHPSKNSVVVVQVRFPSGEPFSMTVDGETFDRMLVPAMHARDAAALSPS